MSTDTELYVHWSHRNFTAGQWREAGERFLELQIALNEAQSKHAEIDHGEDFFECEQCSLVMELEDHYDTFAIHFANLWAIRALQENDALIDELRNTAANMYALALIKFGNLDPDANVLFEKAAAVIKKAESARDVLGVRSTQ